MLHRLLRRGERGVYVGLVVAAVALVACDGGSGTTEHESPIVGIRFGPARVINTTFPPSMLPLTARPVDRAGNVVVTTSPVEFRSLDPAIATVDPSGVLTLLAVGTGRITATVSAGGRVIVDTAFISIGRRLPGAPTSE